MASSIYLKYMWLVKIIGRSSGMTFDEISERWQKSLLNDEGAVLSKRTFRNWINAIGETLGIYIECSKHAPYLYKIWNQHDLDDNLMEWALNAFSIGQLASENSVIRDRILLENIPSADERLSIILSAMRNNHQIKMRYQSFVADFELSFVTEPYAIKLNKNRWYVICHSTAHHKEFVYALDRIIEVEETNKTFIIPKDYSAKAKFEGCVGIYSGEDVALTDVVLKITGYLQDYVATLPIHSSQQLLEKTADYSIFKYRVRPGYEFVDILCGLGACCEVLQPSDLRDRVRENALAIAKNNA